jgi:hypothetical protein
VRRKLIERNFEFCLTDLYFATIIVMNDSIGGFQSTLSAMHEVLFAGVLAMGEDWGGAECGTYVTTATHRTETAAWLALLLGLGLLLDLRGEYARLVHRARVHLALHSASPAERAIEMSVSGLQLAMFGGLTYIKLRDRAMINLTQPCHLLLPLQAAALLSQGELGVVLSIGMLPTIAGALMAMAM